MQSYSFAKIAKFRIYSELIYCYYFAEILKNDHLHEMFAKITYFFPLRAKLFQIISKKTIFSCYRIRLLFAFLRGMVLYVYEVC
jgi:hypothetical protein